MASRFAHPAIHRRGHAPADTYGIGDGHDPICDRYVAVSKQTGGHLNPAITLAFYRLGKLELSDMLFLLRRAIPWCARGRGRRGTCPRRRARKCGCSLCGHSARRLRRRRRVRCRGNHLFRFDEHYSVRLGTRESPSIHTLLWRYFGCCMYSVRIATIGRQCKPGTHVRAGHFRQLLAAVWIYFTAPPFGMLATAEVFLILRGGVGPFCAKLHHANHKRCIFRHGYRTVFTFFG